ncbi:lipopolysaccharide biosynthesis protein [Alteriqipengyuania flavescens]|uniref:lipopolysaccharide biosynthesis protein n=1 Tax=Alteriqipengyuania flavescens TaxID=3053610 RepID=UPI0025B51EA2|nr:lipopolysaccharide biosynthesis protein [Alteriqipengyuania flavescens]WJY17847.1 lipopolysaccharide biosynthesis protein [Alteriqipengyuania flavescens]WJY23788.1 lipopolysaccharide biosynthesis protein [Alteriqipengyuania flavescens]
MSDPDGKGAPPANPATKPGPDAAGGDIAALAKGGQTNFFGFLLRLAARIPFLFIAGRMYGDEAMGRFAAALVIIELTSQLACLGQKRGLAQQLSQDEDRHPSHVIADGMVMSAIVAACFMVLLSLFPDPMFPRGRNDDLALLLPLSILPFCLTEIALAGCAYRYDIGTTVKARAVVEPWTISIAAGVLFYLTPDAGLELAYVLSIFAACFAAFIPLYRAYGLPRGWMPHPRRIGRLAWNSLPLAGADAVEWGSRKLDIAILAQFASLSTIGIYYAVQQVTSLPSKLKTSFEPILGPVITRKLKEKDYKAIGKQVCQVGFWILAMQAGIALALGIPGEAVMGLIGPEFVSGTGALAILLAAEVVAALAVVSEAALIYMARMKNLYVSLFTIGLQAALTIGAMLAIEHYGMRESLKAPAAAAALFITLGTASLVKSFMLGRLLGFSVNNFRWALVYAAAPAVVVGYLATLLPEWLELLVGIPAILGTYGAVIWFRGFGPEDRVLFSRKVRKDAETVP